MKAVTVEFQRFGDPTGVLRKSDRYLRSVGAFTPVRECKMPFDQAQFAGAMRALDYSRFQSGVDPDRIERDAKGLVEQMRGLLADLLPVKPPPEHEGGNYQVEIVTSARELAQLPFELLVDKDRSDCIITRRVRLPWPRPPVVESLAPKILFAWAEPRQPVPHGRHLELLEELLKDWGGLSKAASVLENAKLTDIADQLATPDHGYTHVHLLAHGAEMPESLHAQTNFDLLAEPPPATFLALHAEAGDTHRCSPDELASVFVDGVPRPASFTLATCHSSDVDPIEAGGTFAYNLHSKGIPTVLASQLALTQAGSDELIQTFLKMIIEGEDPRAAIGACRRALYEKRETTYYDWIALTGYVHVDESVERRLPEKKCKVALARMNAASKNAEDYTDFVLKRSKVLSSSSFDILRDDAEKVLAQFSDIRNQLEHLQEKFGQDRALHEEVLGLQASSLKREAEAKWKLSRVLPDATDADTYRSMSHAALELSLKSYTWASMVSRDHHWTAVQSLVLEAVIEGTLENRRNDWLVATVAAHDAISRLAELVASGFPDEGALKNAMWAHCSLAELHLLAPLVGRPDGLDAAKDELNAFIAIFAQLQSPDNQPVTSTLDQLDRYESWWGADRHWRLPTEIVNRAVELCGHLFERSKQFLENDAVYNRDAPRR